MTNIIAFMLGLITSPFLILVLLSFGGSKNDPPTKEEWRELND